MPKTKICSECGKKFVTETKKLTCSPECYRARRARIAREKRQEDLVTRKCLICHKPLADARQRKYCSKECVLIGNTKSVAIRNRMRSTLASKNHEESFDAYCENTPKENRMSYAEWQTRRTLAHIPKIVI